MKEILKEKYGISVKESSLIQQVEDQICWIKDNKGTSYKLKVFKSLSASKMAASQQVYAWTSFLNDQLPIPFTEIVPTLEGKHFIQLAESSDSIASLFTWIDWEIIPSFTSENIHLIGKILQLVHRHSKNYSGPRNAIKMIDAQWVQQYAKVPILAAAKQSGRFKREQIHCLNSNIEWLANWMQEQQEREAFGLIHSDLHRKNIVQKNSTISFIDFEDSVYSAYLLDIGILLNEFADYPDQYQEFKSALLDGYGLTLDQQLNHTLLHFQAIGDLIYADWIFADSDTGGIFPFSKVKYAFAAIQNLINFEY